MCGCGPEPIQKYVYELYEKYFILHAVNSSKATGLFTGTG